MRRRIKIANDLLFWEAFEDIRAFSVFNQKKKKTRLKWQTSNIFSVLIRFRSKISSISFKSIDLFFFSFICEYPLALNSIGKFCHRVHSVCISHPQALQNFFFLKKTHNHIIPPYIFFSFTSLWYAASQKYKWLSKFLGQTLQAATFQCIPFTILLQHFQALYKKDNSK